MFMHDLRDAKRCRKPNGEESSEVLIHLFTQLKAGGALENMMVALLGKCGGGAWRWGRERVLSIFESFVLFCAVYMAAKTLFDVSASTI